MTYAKMANQPHDFDLYQKNRVFLSHSLSPEYDLCAWALTLHS